MMIAGAIPEYDQLALREFGAPPPQDFNGVLAVGSWIGPPTHLPLIVHVQSLKRALGRQAGRGGMDPEALAALRPARSQVRILGDMRLVQVDPPMAVARRAVQHRLQALQESLALGRIGPTEPLLGRRPRQVQPMQRGAEGLAAQQPADPPLDPLHQPAPRPARRRRPVGARGPGRSRLGVTDHAAERGLNLGAKIL